MLVKLGSSEIRFRLSANFGPHILGEVVESAGAEMCRAVKRYIRVFFRNTLSHLTYPFGRLGSLPALFLLPIFRRFFDFNGFEFNIEEAALAAIRNLEEL